MAETVFLDACVLFPWVVRELLFGAAGTGLFRPAWSPRVLAEWQIAAARDGAAAEEAAREGARALRRLGGVEAIPDPEVEARLALPDPADAHVLAGAAAAGATTLLTFNLRDFPARRLGGLAIAPRHPDGFLWELLGREPVAMRRLIDDVVAAAGREPSEGRKLLKRSGLPRLGKAWAGG